MIELYKFTESQDSRIQKTVYYTMIRGKMAARTREAEGYYKVWPAVVPVTGAHEMTNTLSSPLSPRVTRVSSSR
uniref:Uncharacterized protein n=1 Tax=Arundo donax TaxID=35708 RepID=A0A0A9DLE4_ARUDO